MGVDRRKNYCTIDHSNKQKELAEQTPYQFWLGQVKRKGTGASESNLCKNIDTMQAESRR